MGFLACAAGLLPRPQAVTPYELVGEFSWAKVGRADRVITEEAWQAL